MKIVSLILLTLLQSSLTERARFTVAVDGRPVGTEDFSIVRRGDGFLAQGSIRLEIDGQRIDAESRMELDADLRPLSYEYRSGSDRIRVEIGPRVTEVEFTVDGVQTPYDIRFPAGGMIIDDNFFHHYLLLLHRLGEGGGDVPVFVPQQMTLGTLQVEPAGEGSFRLSTENLKLDAVTDAEGRLVRLVLVDANVVVER